MWWWWRSRTARWTCDAHDNIGGTGKEAEEIEPREWGNRQWYHVRDREGDFTLKIFAVFAVRVVLFEDRQSTRVPVLGTQ